MKLALAFLVGLAAGWLLKPAPGPAPEALPPAPTAPAPERGDGALLRRLQDSEARVALLQREIQEQDRRRMALESALAETRVRPQVTLAASGGAGPSLEDPEALVRRLESADPAVRISAVRALGMLGEKERAGAIARLLESPDAQERIATLEALSRLKERSVLARIAKRLQDPDPTVKGWALKAISSTEGQAFRDDGEALTWLSRHP